MFVCSCGLKFSRKNNFSFHKRRECGKKFPCPYCPFSSSTNCNLKKHVTLQHLACILANNKQHFYLSSYATYICKVNGKKLCLFLKFDYRYEVCKKKSSLLSVIFRPCMFCSIFSLYKLSCDNHLIRFNTIAMDLGYCLN